MRNFFSAGVFFVASGKNPGMIGQIGMKKEFSVTQQRSRTLAGQADDGLGANSDIGSRLRALYGAVQDEGVPEQLLDLLEKLDSAEQAQKHKLPVQDGE